METLHSPRRHLDLRRVCRLQCERQGLFRCRLTGLQLEGVGDVLYQLVPWDLDFLSSKGLRPAGPLFRFTLLSGRFHRLHLPHCQLLSGQHAAPLANAASGRRPADLRTLCVAEGGEHFLSVVHATEERVGFISPSHVTQSHVVVDVPGFSCFGLVTGQRNDGAVRGLVVIFSEMSERSLFVLLLPRNICLTQVHGTHADLRALLQRVPRKNAASFIFLIFFCLCIM